MGEVLHAGALAATAVSTCCVAASGRRLRVRDLLLGVLMLLAMADVVLGTGVLAPTWWALALLVASLVVGVTARVTSVSERSARAMDALGGVLMAALLIVMSAGHAAPASGSALVVGTHSGHGPGAAALVALIALVAVAFAAVSVYMGATMRMPVGSAAADAYPARWASALRRAAPISMGVSIALMAAVAVA